MIQLKGGFKTTDPKLDRIPQWDSKNLSYPISTVIPTDIKRGKSWPNGFRLNQGIEGACVGFGFEHELGAAPVKWHASYDHARWIYKQAQHEDEWPGEDYEGTSVLAGAKILKREGFIDEYRWAFTIDDVIRTIVHAGPIVFGTDWLDGMWDTRPSGLIEVNGSVVGGHCYLVRGVILKPKLPGESLTEPVLRITNSWGSRWGRMGECFMKASDAERLIKANGDACVPLGRHLI